MTLLKLTLVFVFRDGQVLLGLKKRGFGEGLWNGFGGKVNEGETILEGAIRELNEESGLTGKNLEQVALLYFDFEKDLGKYKELEIHVLKHQRLKEK